MPPHLKTPVVIVSAPTLEEKIFYLGDENCPSHIFYCIEITRISRGQTMEEFIAEADYHRRVYNLGLDPAHRVKNLADWFMITFARGSKLTKSERQRVENLVLSHLAKDGRYVVGWHIHAFTGECDLNVITPNVQCPVVPRLARDRGENSFLRLRHALDRLTQELNAERRAANVPCIPEMHRVRRPRRLVVKVTQKAKELGLVPSKENLVLIFTALGRALGRVCIDGDQLVYPARRKGGRRRFQSIPQFVAEISTFLIENAAPKTAQELVKKTAVTSHEKTPEPQGRVVTR